MEKLIERNRCSQINHLDTTNELLTTVTNFIAKNPSFFAWSPKKYKNLLIFVTPTFFNQKRSTVPLDYSLDNLAWNFLTITERKLKKTQEIKKRNAFFCWNFPLDYSKLAVPGLRGDTSRRDSQFWEKRFWHQ